MKNTLSGDGSQKASPDINKMRHIFLACGGVLLAGLLGLLLLQALTQQAQINRVSWLTRNILMHEPSHHDLHRLAQLLRPMAVPSGTTIQSRRQRLLALVERRSSSTSLAKEDAFAAFIKAQTLVQGQDWKAARSTLQAGIHLDPRLLPLYWYLAQTFAMLGDVKSSKIIEAELGGMIPTFRFGQIAVGSASDPWRPIPRQLVANGWALQGYDLWDEAEVPFRRQIGIALYWEADHPICSAKNDRPGIMWKTANLYSYASGRRVWQWGFLPNLAPDPGFESGFLSYSQFVRSPSWQNLHYFSARDQVIDLILSPRDDQPNIVSRLWNVRGGPSGIDTKPIDLLDTREYLFSGKVNTTSPSTAGMAYAWYDSLKQPIPDSDHFSTCLLCGYPQPAGWRRISTIALSPTGARRVCLWLLNHGAGKVLFDDILFIPIRLPVLPAECSVAS